MLFHFFHKKTYPSGTAPRELILYERSMYKSYPRFAQIRLPEPLLATGRLHTLLEHRTTKRNFDSRPVALRDVSSILWGAGAKSDRCAEEKNEFGERALRRRYPSGGALYPLEIYLGAARIEGLAPGIYHYDVKKHGLEEMAESDRLAIIQKSAAQPEMIAHAAGVLMMTAVWHRSSMKYGEFAYRAALIEAGHLAHNLLLIAESLGIACSPFAGFDYEATDAALDLEGCNENLVYGLMIGHVKKYA